MSNAQLTTGNAQNQDDSVDVENHNPEEQEKLSENEEEADNEQNIDLEVVGKSIISNA